MVEILYCEKICNIHLANVVSSLPRFDSIFQLQNFIRPYVTSFENYFRLIDVLSSLFFTDLVFVFFFYFSFGHYRFSLWISCEKFGGSFGGEAIPRWFRPRSLITPANFGSYLAP